MVSAVAVWIIGGLILSSSIKKELAFSVMFIKVAIVVIYFTSFADGGWFYGGDDRGYFERGMQLFETGRTPINLWSDPTALYLASTKDSLWYFFVYNYLAIYAFGPHYYSPVFFNLICSALTAVFLGSLVKRLDESPLYHTWFVVFASLHWMTIAWTSFLDLKEPLIACLMAIALASLVRLPKKFFQGIAGTTIAVVLLLKIRYYFPALIMVGYLAAVAFEYRNVLRKRKIAMIVFVVPLTSVVAWFMQAQIGLFMSMADFGRFPYEVAHFILQPMPWNVSSTTSYLFLPSILHWLFFLPGLIGGFLIWHRSLAGRVVCLTLLGGVIFYGVISLLASTRHRMPFDVMFIIFQFHFFWTVFAKQSRPSDLIRGQWSSGK